MQRGGAGHRRRVGQLEPGFVDEGSRTQGGPGVVTPHAPREAPELLVGDAEQFVQRLPVGIGGFGRGHTRAPLEGVGDAGRIDLTPDSGEAEAGVLPGGGAFSYRSAMPIGTQLVLLFIFAVPVACVSWTVTHEEVFREPREWLTARSNASRSILARKFFYLFTCEYCFSHYVTIGMLALTGFTMVFPDWRGYLIAGFSLVWIANLYMSLFGRLRLAITSERQDIAVVEKMVQKEEAAEEVKA